jgi:hypothetical protein
LLEVGHALLLPVVEEVGQELGQLVKVCTRAEVVFEGYELFSGTHLPIKGKGW